MNKRQWTQAEDARLRELYPDHQTSNVAILMNRSQVSIIGRAFKLRLRKSDAFKDRMKSTDEKFVKGHTPKNKGKKWEEYMSAGAIERCTATQFKPGQTPATYKGGTLDKRENTFKVSKNGKRVALKRWVWEQNFGAIPTGMAICCKDGDPYNCDISNLEMRRIGFNTKDRWAQMTPEQRKSRGEKIARSRRRNDIIRKYGTVCIDRAAHASRKKVDAETLRRRAQLDCMPNPFEFLTRTNSDE